MTVVRPFRAVHYAPDRVDLSKVMVPPYDVVAADERGSFFDRDPHNAIRFELTRDVKDEAELVVVADPEKALLGHVFKIAFDHLSVVRFISESIKEASKRTNRCLLTMNVRL